MTGREALEKSLIDMSKIADNLQARIDKAIEYCYDNSYELVTTDEEIPAGRYESNDFDIEELLDILKGSDSNDNE